MKVAWPRLVAIAAVAAQGAVPALALPRQMPVEDSTVTLAAATTRTKCSARRCWHVGGDYYRPYGYYRPYHAPDVDGRGRSFGVRVF